MDFSDLIKKIKVLAEKSANSPKALVVMALLCFLEPIFIPMIPEVVIAPVLITRKPQRFQILMLAVGSCLLGVCVTYFLSNILGTWILSWLGDAGQILFKTGIGYLHKYGYFLPFMGSLFPLPLKIITWTSGLTNFHLGLLLTGIGLGRAVRYSILLLIPAKDPL